MLMSWLFFMKDIHFYLEGEIETHASQKEPEMRTPTQLFTYACLLVIHI